MTKKNITITVIISIILALAVGLSIIFLRPENNETNQSSSQNTPQTNTAPVNDGGEIDSQVSAVVTYTDNGFDPITIGPIQVGDTVRFVNDSSSQMWVASDNHPDHTIYPEFDQLGAAKNGENYEFTFEQAGTWDYHNHLNPSRQGKIEVLSN